MPFNLDIFFINEISNAVISFFLNVFIKWGIFLLVILLILKSVKNLTPFFRHLLFLVCILSIFCIAGFSFFIRENIIDLDITKKYKMIHNNLYDHISKINQGIFQIHETIINPDDYPEINKEPVYISFYFLMIWLTGFIFSFFHIIFGNIRLKNLINHSKINVRSKIRTLSLNIKNDMKIKRKINIYFSKNTLVPFTFKTINPCIILPLRSKRSSYDELYPILIHEFAHIKRYDYLTQNLSRFICSLFWFIPFIWILYKKQKLEQEKICDSYVIKKGIIPSKYALQLVNFFKIIPKKKLEPLVQFAEYGKSSLELRIISIMNNTKININKNYYKILISISIISLSFLLLSFINIYNFSYNNILIENSIKEKFCGIDSINWKFLPKDYFKNMNGTPLLWPINDYHSNNKEFLENFSEDNFLYIHSGKTFASVYATGSGYIEEITMRTEKIARIVIRHKNGIRSIYSNIIINKNLSESKYISIGTFIGLVPMYNKSNSSYFLYIITKNNKMVSPNDYLYKLGKPILKDD
jgi:beta-lactamase regulating signal transducer with metallopeptidase domain